MANDEMDNNIFNIYYYYRSSDPCSILSMGNGNNAEKYETVSGRRVRVGFPRRDKIMVVPVQYHLLTLMVSHILFLKIGGGQLGGQYIQHLSTKQTFYMN